MKQFGAISAFIEFFFHNGVLRIAVWYNYIMAKSVGWDTHRAILGIWQLWFNLCKWISMSIWINYVCLFSFLRNTLRKQLRKKSGAVYRKVKQQNKLRIMPLMWKVSSHAFIEYYNMRRLLICPATVYKKRNILRSLVRNSTS